MERGVGVLVTILVVMMFLSSSIALADVSVLFGPNEAYETNRLSFSLNISNFRSSYEITGVHANIGGFDAGVMANYAGWNENKSGSDAYWTGGSIANNIILASFEFLGEAHVVDQDTSTQALITLLDSNNQEHTFTFPLTIKDDTTSPSLSDMVPQDGGFMKEGASSQQVQVRVADPETGVKNVSLHWVMCNFTENVTPYDHTLQLAESAGIYQNSIDLSEFTNGHHICFDYTAYNKGGSAATYSGQLTIDGVPPDVTLVSPVDGAIIGLGKNFSFFAADNLAQEMQCKMYIDGSEYMKDIAAQHMDVEFISSADVEEGNHTWSMRCVDPAGWEGKSATWGYTLDKTPPKIEMISPANNSLIKDASLQFKVTDNTQVHKVWLVVNGSATEVGEEFSIETAGWPEGPSEFAVRAEDSVRNQAEQTYRVIVDRSPPQVELAGPEDGGDSDVHVNFTYTAQDNYDDEMDCIVYIDNAGQQQHVAKEGALTGWPKQLAIGEHRWNVQCVDDAGNVGKSSDRVVSVIDTSGPDMVLNNPDLVTRGDPVTISLDVTDISGVSAVTANLKGPDGNIQAIPLERVGDTYTASVETTANTAVGIYTLEVYAVDTLNNSFSTTDSISVSYKYIVALDIAPTSATPGATVVASGLVKFDNGSLVPEQSVKLMLPGNVTQDLQLDASGAYSHIFQAPASDGSYAVVALASCMANSLNYSSTETLTVSTGGNGGGGGGSGSGSGTMSVSDSSCSAEWSCEAWAPCKNSRQARTCVDLNKCGDAAKTQERACSVKEKSVTEDENDDTATEANTVSADREPIPDSEEQQVDAAGEDQGNAAGIGKASGFMSALDISPWSIILALALMGVLLGTLYKFGWSKSKRNAFDFLGSGGSDGMGLESYLEDRASRRGKF